jgi:hypothetical protein
MPFVIHQYVLSRFHLSVTQKAGDALRSQRATPSGHSLRHLPLCRAPRPLSCPVSVSAVRVEIPLLERVFRRETQHDLAAPGLGAPPSARCMRLPPSFLHLRCRRSSFVLSCCRFGGHAALRLSTRSDRCICGCRAARPAFLRRSRLRLRIPSPGYREDVGCGPVSGHQGPRR